MTVFGRDTLITCLQTLMFGPELARSALDVLANLQATEDNPAIDAEPGKIVHEVRRGRRRGTGSRPTTARSTRHRCTWSCSPRSGAGRTMPLSSGTSGTRRCARSPGSTTTAISTATGSSSTGSGQRRASTTSRGKTRGTRSALGRPHRGAPIAPVEARGYVYDERRMAELAREVWRDRELSDRLDREADELQARFDQAFWNESRGGYYVLALDGEKRQVDSACSNMGHLLWTGIVPMERVDKVVDALMGPDLWSGWGCGRCPLPTPATTRSRTTPARCGPMTTPDRLGTGPLCALARSAENLQAHAERLGPLRPPAAGGLRGAAPRRDAVSDCLPDGGATSGLGGRDTVLLLQQLLGLQPDRPSAPLRSVASGASCRRGPA